MSSQENVIHIKEPLEQVLQYLAIVTHKYKPQAGRIEILGKYPNGKIQYRALVNDYWVEGEVCFYYPDGKLKARENYRRSQRHGRRFEYYPSGALRLEERYVEGRREGIVKTFDEKTGRILGKQLYVQGFPEDGYLHSLLNKRNLTAGDILEIKDPWTREICLQELGGDGVLLAQLEEKWPAWVRIEHTRAVIRLVRILLSKIHPEEEDIKLLDFGRDYPPLRVPPDCWSIQWAQDWAFRINPRKGEKRFSPLVET
jgi:hypothetical protein